MGTSVNINPTRRAGDQTKQPRRLRCVVVVLGLVAVGSFAGSSTAHASATWQRQQLDDDACYDSATMDADGNGNAEVIWFDLDNDCKFDTRLWNSVGSDNFAESLTFDMNEDGHWETWLADNDQIAGFDVAYFDDNGDGLYDRREYLASVLNTNTGPGTSVMIIGGTDRGSLVPVSGFVGPVTNPDPMYTLILRLAEATGTVAYSPPDSDGDGWYDHEDARPSDPYRH